MTSVFCSNYNQLLERIQASASERPARQQAPSSSSPEFSQILADLEQVTENNSVTNELSEPVAPPPPLTNLDSEEEGQSRARLADAPPTFSLVAPPPAIDEIGVKGDLPSVKEPPPGGPPQPVLPAPGTAPSVPVVIGVKRMEPTVPSVGSVPRVDGTIHEIVVTAGKYHGIDPALGLAVAQAESSFIPDAVSRDGHFSKGIFQLLDSTAHEMMEFSGVEEPYEPFDPAMNTYLGMGYLRRLMDMFSQPTQLSLRTTTVAAKSAEDLEKLAVAAFNAGQGSVARAQARAQANGRDPSEYAAVEPHLPASTREYVRRVSEHRQRFANAAASTAIV
ncbi:MAG: transglycosylase SLT domain-containing protein [Bdellovibrionales bacterium]|nr:transglycosylase SLT domain-containing protein [Bdellovibrionales bacterium]